MASQVDRFGFESRSSSKVAGILVTDFAAENVLFNV